MFPIFAKLIRFFVGWVERSETQLSMLGCAALHPTYLKNPTFDVGLRCASPNLLKKLLKKLNFRCWVALRFAQPTFFETPLKKAIFEIRGHLVGQFTT
jgi:hypothetical protein